MQAHVHLQLLRYILSLDANINKQYLHNNPYPESSELRDSLLRMSFLLPIRHRNLKHVPTSYIASQPCTQQKSSTQLAM